MRDLGSWSFGRVMLASALWVVLVVFAAAAGIYLLVRAASTGSGGIGAVSPGPGVLGIVLSLLAILFGPPLVLLFTWLYRRRRK
jgi:hypothetical protein